MKTRELDSIEPRSNKCLSSSSVRGMFRISVAESFPRYRMLAPHSLNSGIDDESSSRPRISHCRTGAFTPCGYRGLIPAETILEERYAGRVTEGWEGKASVWPRSRLTRWTHYHSSIWGTFGRSDQWLSIPCNGVRSDIRHRGTPCQGRYNWSTLSSFSSPSFPNPTARWKRSRATRGSVLAPREKPYPTMWKDHTGIGTSGECAGGGIRERRVCKGREGGRGERERDRGESRSAFGTWPRS